MAAHRLNMSPAFAVSDGCNTFSGNKEASAEIGGFLAVFKFLTYLQNILFTQFGFAISRANGSVSRKSILSHSFGKFGIFPHSVSVALSGQTIPGSVSKILLTRDKFKIFKIIVGLVSVFMVYLQGLIALNKRYCNKAMDFLGFSLAVICQSNDVVAVRVKHIFKDTLFRVKLIGDNSFDSSKIANRVNREGFNCFPNFHILNIA